MRGLSGLRTMVDHTIRTRLQSVPKQTRNCRELRAIDQVSRLLVNHLIGHADTCIDTRMDRKCLGNIFEICTATRQHDAIGQLLLEACLLDLLDHQIGEIVHTSLDCSRQIALQNALLALGRAVLDTHILRSICNHRATELNFQFLNVFIGNTQRTDIAIDCLRTHRNRRNITHHVVEIDRDIGHIATQIYDRYALLLLVLSEQSFGRHQRVDMDSQRLDTQLQSSIGQALNGRMQTENEIERRREALTERTDRIGHLFVAIDDEILGDTLQNHLIATRCAHLLHTCIEFVDVALADAVSVVAHRHPIGVARATNKVARDTEIGLKDLDSELLFDLRHRRIERFRCQVDVVDGATNHALRPLTYHSLDLHFIVGTARSRSYGDVVRAEINCYYVVLLFHVYIVFYSLFVT